MQVLNMPIDTELVFVYRPFLVDKDRDFFFSLLTTSLVHVGTSNSNSEL